MNPRIIKFILGFAVLLCIGLSGFWLRAKTEQHTMQQAIADAQSALEKANQQLTPLQASSAENAATIAAKQTALDQSPGAREALRRESSLKIIAQLKNLRATNPPAPRQKAPPTGPNGFDFEELLSDPEYNQLCCLNMRQLMKRSEEAPLSKLGLSSEICEKVINLLADQYMMRLDHSQLLGAQAFKGEGVKLRQAKDQEFNNEIKALMGETAYNQWRAVDPSTSLLGEDGRSYLMPLATRLSYSSTPLTSSQTDQLARLLKEKTPPRSGMYQTATTDAFISSSGTILLPEQVEALRLLQTEQQAKTKRAKMPKSSELPRSAQAPK